jgi:hypothetical protein
MGMRFSTWNVRNLYRGGALSSVTSEVEKYRMDLVGVQKVSWEGNGTFESGNYILFYGEDNINHQLGINAFKFHVFAPMGRFQLE